MSFLCWHVSVSAFLAFQYAWDRKCWTEEDIVGQVLMDSLVTNTVIQSLFSGATPRRLKEHMFRWRLTQSAILVGKDLQLEPGKDTGGEPAGTLVLSCLLLLPKGSLIPPFVRAS